MNQLLQTRKIILAWAGVFLFRLVLLPVRAPNVEPLLATLMPVSKGLGMLQSFAFAALSITLYDAVTSGIGLWTLVTAFAYGLLGVAAHAYFTNREGTRTRFVGFAIVSTLLYDAATGLTVGPLFFGQPLAVAAAGQIPFTLLHLAGNVAFAATLSPVLARWLAVEPRVSEVAVQQVA